MGCDRYVLDDNGEPVPEPDLMKWAACFEEDEKRRLAFDEIGEVHVSTVFLGLDHSFGDGQPILWETMIFGGKHDEYQSKALALEGHAAAVRMVKADA